MMMTMRCEMQIDRVGLATLSPHRLSNHAPCTEEARYLALFLVGPDERVEAMVCVEHALDARYPEEMWRAANPNTLLEPGTRFVPCIRMRLIKPVDVEALSNELSDLALA